MVSEMDTVKGVANAVSNSTYLAANPSPQPMHSPQSVGVEFVRQYYTMLNRAPNLLYRFYSEDSTFIHGCLDKHGELVPYVRGQKQINAKIMSLNFNNCHTKIRQVDSMETIGNGVVIQVIGELSNNGQPLRRFLQTFVLTPQSPNKYYVRNDIFRYHDEVFGEESDAPNAADAESKVEHHAETESFKQADLMEKDYSYQTNGTCSSSAAVVASSAVPAASVVDSAPATVEESVDMNEEPESVQETSLEANTSLADVSESNTTTTAKEAAELEEESEPVSEIAPIASNQLSNEPKTYASMLLSKGFQPGSGPAAAAAPVPPTPIVNQVASNKPPAPVNIAPAVPPVVNNNNATSDVSSVIEPSIVAQPPAPKNAGFPPQRDRFAKKSGGGGGAVAGGGSGGFNRRNESRESAKNNNNDSDSADGDTHFTNSTTKKSFSTSPDEHQLFIGNLLPNFSEEELANIFSRFGKIVDVRINRQSHKANSNKANRNFGFITFEDPAVVDHVIAQKPIYYGNHRYNVEKKQGRNNNFREERNRNNQPNSVNSSRNGGNQPNQPSNAPPLLRGHGQMNSGGQANLGPRLSGGRSGPNFANSANNNGGGSRNFGGGGQNFPNRNNFAGGHPQNR